MDNLTHTVIGLALARAWSARTVLEGATLVASANLPDLDSLVESSLGLERDRLFAHRGIVHSLAAAPIEIVALATVVWTIAASSETEGRSGRRGGASR